MDRRGSGRRKLTANPTASPEGSILTPHGWVTGKVEFAGHLISEIDGRTLAKGAKPEGPFVLPGFIDLHVHGGGGGDWQDGEEGIRTFMRYHASYGTTAIAPTTAIGPIPVIEKSLSAISSITMSRRSGEAVVLGAHLEGPFLNPSNQVPWKSLSFWRATQRWRKDGLRSSRS